MRGVDGKATSNIGLRAGDRTHVVLIMRPNPTTDCGARNEFIPFEDAPAASPLQPWSNVSGFAPPSGSSTGVRRAAIEHISARPAAGEQIDGQTVRTQIRLDYVPGLTTEMRVRHLIEFHGQAPRYVDYAIEAFLDVDERRRHMVLKCIRLQESPTT